MPSRGQEQLHDRIERVVAHLRERMARQPGAGEAEAFVRRYFERVALDDIADATVESLYGAALSLWNFGAERQPGTLKLRVYNPRLDEHGWACGHTVVEIVNDDMPFLVDSVTMAVAGAGQTIHLMVHPIIAMQRDAKGGRTAKGGQTVTESFMHLQIDAQSDAAALAAIEAKLRADLADVRAAVGDWKAMLVKLDETLQALAGNPPPLAADEVGEVADLLRWMRDDNFTFLGYREYDYNARPGEEPMNITEGTGLGILRDSARRVMVGREGFISASPEVLKFLTRQELLIITKANARSTVHRPVHLDYIGVRQFDQAGNVLGERRFIGLFTSAAYNRNPRDIPVLRRKVRRIIERAGFPPQSHDGKALLNILETYPRDELFQIGEDDLFAIVMAILHLQQRPRIALFARRDAFGRYVTFLAYVPRERYDSQLRRRIADVLTEALGGRVSAFYTHLGDDPLARIHFIIAVQPGQSLEFDAEEIGARVIAAARSWTDDLHEALLEQFGEEAGVRLWNRYAGAFSADYRKRYDVPTALFDIAKFESLGDAEALGVNLYRPLEAAASELQFKLYHRGAPVPLSDCLPMLEHMGLKVIEEHPFEIEGAAGEPSLWLHDFRLQTRSGVSPDLARVKDKFEAAFARVWRGGMEDDGFNQLVLLAELDWREVVVLRAYSRYLRQIGTAFSQSYMEETLTANAGLARLLVDRFHAEFDPGLGAGRAALQQGLDEQIGAGLDAVVSLDQDRILRWFLNLIQATQRTNFYQRGPDGGPKPCLALKLASDQVDGLPLPKPMVEIWVYSPRVEGIHLRGGKVARGGIRWSDRREDFRTEVLGLMKAQMVKNAVIVPVGAKGGFVPKRPPIAAGREAAQADGVECYKAFVRALLDVTDNRVGETIVPPPDLVRRDGDDPYLVVAADKGTATFSDIANGISAEFGFWLGDAFASGGSAGYDHKKMAITAKGAWEAVKRHFRELGKEIQATDYTAVGIGDMSGDVFGNGMLLSPHTRLLAAFDHRHVFVDPAPDAARSFAERRRLFDLPRSSWADYRTEMLSPGGAVFDRQSKSLQLTPEIKQLFALDSDRLTPAELIHAILTADVDLLWIGGIGTYVKASDETHTQVNDRANDALRVNGRDLRAKVVGEGGNLGCTQRGRIEYALAGGRLNTDAVDNSAGVDCSDHEVNIKILLNAVVAEGELTTRQRDRLLADMTGNVAELVLRDNYLQTQAISMMELQGPWLLPSLARFMRDLESRGRLDRAVEFLPDDAAVAARQAAGGGLTRPELAVLLAYAKSVLYSDLLETDLPEDRHFIVDLTKYFPRAVRRPFADAIAKHRLRREIIATSIANSMVNRMGINFVSDIQEDTEVGVGAIARAYAVSREAFEIRHLWAEIELLDGRVPARLQLSMLLAINELVRRTTIWFLRTLPGTINLETAIAAYGPGIATLAQQIGTLASGPIREQMDARARELTDQGVPAALAASVAALDPLAAALDLVEAGKAAGRSIADAAQVYFALGDRLGLDWLRRAAGQVQPADYWQRLAMNAAVEDLDVQQRLLTGAVLNGANGAAALEAVAGWEQRQGAVLGRVGRVVAEFTAAGSIDLARLAIATRHLRSMRAG